MPSTTTKCLGFKYQPLFLRKFRQILNSVRLSPLYWPHKCDVAFRYSALPVLRQIHQRVKRFKWIKWVVKRNLPYWSNHHCLPSSLFYLNKRYFQCCWCGWPYVHYATSSNQTFFIHSQSSDIRSRLYFWAYLYYTELKTLQLWAPKTYLN